MTVVDIRTPAARYVNGVTPRFEEEYDRAEKAREHLWSVVVHYGLTAAQLEHAATAREVMLDGGPMYGVMFGCFVCETEYDPRAVGTRCPGEPAD